MRVVHELTPGRLTSSLKYKKKKWYKLEQLSIVPCFLGVSVTSSHRRIPANQRQATGVARIPRGALDGPEALREPAPTTTRWLIFFETTDEPERGATYIVELPPTFF